MIDVGFLLQIVVIRVHIRLILIHIGVIPSARDQPFKHLIKQEILHISYLFLGDIGGIFCIISLFYSCASEAR